MDAWWRAVSELPSLKAAMLLVYNQFPRIATMNVQRLQLEEDFKEGNVLLSGNMKRRLRQKS